MNERLILDKTQEWKESDGGYPDPTVIVVDENTDFNKIHEKVQPLKSSSPKVRRVLIGLKIFGCEKDFEDWQREEPREILEITPTTVAAGSVVKSRIYVTYSNGIIE